MILYVMKLNTVEIYFPQSVEMPQKVSCLRKQGFYKYLGIRTSINPLMSTSFQEEHRKLRADFGFFFSRNFTGGKFSLVLMD